MTRSEDNNMFLHWTEPLSQIKFGSAVNSTIENKFPVKQGEVEAELRRRRPQIESVRELNSVSSTLTFIRNNPIYNSPVINLDGISINDSLQILQWRIAKGIDNKEEGICCALPTLSHRYEELVYEIIHLCHGNDLEHFIDHERILIELPEHIGHWYFFKDNFEYMYRSHGGFR